MRPNTLTGSNKHAKCNYFSSMALNFKCGFIQEPFNFKFVLICIFNGFRWLFVYCLTKFG